MPTDNIFDFGQYEPNSGGHVSKWNGADELTINLNGKEIPVVSAEGVKNDIAHSNAQVLTINGTEAGSVGLNGKGAVIWQFDIHNVDSPINNVAVLHDPAKETIVIYRSADGRLLEVSAIDMQSKQIGDISRLEVTPLGDAQAPFQFFFDRFDVGVGIAPGMDITPEYPSNLNLISRVHPDLDVTHNSGTEVIAALREVLDGAWRSLSTDGTKPVRITTEPRPQ